MTGFIIMTAAAFVFAAFALLAVQFGADSRPWSTDGRSVSLFGAR